jgi:pseudouridine kinase
VIVVAGGALVDVRASTASSWVADQSLPGVVRLSAGGAARNVAVHLARLGHRVALLSAVGTDPLGRWLLEATEAAGVDVGDVLRVEAHTGLYVTVGPQGGPAYCVADARPVESLTPQQIAAWAPLLARASVVVGDANLSADGTRALAALSEGRPRVLLTTSREKAPRLRGALAGAAMLVGTCAEAAALVALPSDDAWQRIGAALLASGVAQAVLTRGSEGVGVVGPFGAVWAPAVDSEVVDATGAGDAVAAASVHALARGFGPVETAELAAAAAAVVVRSEENTPADLTDALRSLT